MPEISKLFSQQIVSARAGWNRYLSSNKRIQIWLPTAHRQRVTILTACLLVASMVLVIPALTGATSASAQAGRPSRIMPWKPVPYRHVNVNRVAKKPTSRGDDQSERRDQRAQHT